MEQYVGEIRQVAFPFAPVGWLLCQGQIVTVQEYEQLFYVLGGTYGGDGVNTFGIPNLGGASPVHMGTLQGNSYTVGEVGGAESVTLVTTQMPLHQHRLGANDQTSGTTPTNVPTSQVYGQETNLQPYEPSFNGSTGLILAPSKSPAQPHENRMPFLTISYIIATEGQFPVQNAEAA